jgi:hypothetical protein
MSAARIVNAPAGYPAFDMPAIARRIGAHEGQYENSESVIEFPSGPWDTSFGLEMTFVVPDQARASLATRRAAFDIALACGTGVYRCFTFEALNAFGAWDEIGSIPVSDRWRETTDTLLIPWPATAEIHVRVKGAGGKLDAVTASLR